MSKIAVCFHGAILNNPSYRNDKKNINKKNKSVLPKSIIESLNSFKKNVLDVNPSIDIYLHCWNKKYEKEILKILRPKKFFFENQKKFGIPNKLSLIFFFIKKNFSLNPILFIKNIIQLKNSWGKKTNSTRIKGVYSRWNSAKKVYNLIDKKNNYNYVFLSRYDLFFLKPIIFSNYHNNLIHLPNTPDLFDKNNKRVPLNLYFSKKNKGEMIKRKSNNKFIRGFDDLFLIASYQNIRFIKNLFDMIDEYFNEGVELNNHYLLKHHLKKEKIIKKIKLSVDRIFEIDLTRRVIDKSEY